MFLILLTAPVYKPAPSPYEARQILTPDSSVKKYSFKIIEPAPKAAPEATTAEVPTAEINLRRGQEEERQSRLLINEIIPENDFDEEISTEGDSFFLITYLHFYSSSFFKFHLLCYFTFVIPYTRCFDSRNSF